MMETGDINAIKVVDYAIQAVTTAGWRGAITITLAAFPDVRSFSLRSTDVCRNFHLKYYTPSRATPRSIIVNKRYHQTEIVKKDKGSTTRSTAIPLSTGFR